MYIYFLSCKRMPQEYCVSSRFLEWMLCSGLLEANVCAYIKPIAFFTRASHSSFYLFTCQEFLWFDCYAISRMFQLTVAGSETLVIAHQTF